MRRSVEIRIGGGDEYSSAAILYDDTASCGQSPECGCDGECARREPVAARPMFLIVEFILLASIFALSGLVVWALAHFTGGVHA
jgi:hypothetical protein